MRLMFLGDVVGRPGRDAVHGLLGLLRRCYRLDAVVVNCENAAGGQGMLPELADAFFYAGVDVLTGGNHIWHHKEINAYMNNQPRLIRPANYPHGPPGRGSCRVELTEGRSLGVIQVQGRVFMPPLDCPFDAVKRELDRVGPVTALLLDVHAEATSEKQALAWYFDGRLSAVIGTHTHVQTADERILPKGTAYLTDAGMTGPYDSVIGMGVQGSIQRFLTQRYARYEVASHNIRLCGAVVEVDDLTGRALRIERIQVPWPLAEDSISAQLKALA